MLTGNINVAYGLFNGSVGTVEIACVMVIKESRYHLDGTEGLPSTDVNA